MIAGDPFLGSKEKCCELFSGYHWIYKTKNFCSFQFFKTSILVNYNVEDLKIYFFNTLIYNVPILGVLQKDRFQNNNKFIKDCLSKMPESMWTFWVLCLNRNVNWSKVNRFPKLSIHHPLVEQISRSASNSHHWLSRCCYDGANKPNHFIYTLQDINPRMAYLHLNIKLGHNKPF